MREKTEQNLRGIEPAHVSAVVNALEMHEIFVRRGTELPGIRRFYNLPDRRPPETVKKEIQDRCKEIARRQFESW